MKKTSLEKLKLMKGMLEKAGWPLNDTFTYHQICGEIRRREG